MWDAWWIGTKHALPLKLYLPVDSMHYKIRVIVYPKQIYKILLHVSNIENKLHEFLNYA